MMAVLWQDVGHVDQRSRCPGRHTEAESTGEGTGDTAVATTGVARTTAARSISSAWQGTRCDRDCTCEHPKSKKCIGKVHDLCTPTPKLKQSSHAHAYSSSLYSKSSWLALAATRYCAS